MSYQVRTPVFEGPLHLLLALVEREQLNLTQVSLSAICTQYWEYLQLLQELDLDLESGYLIVLTELLELKSRLLLPDEPDIVGLDELSLEDEQGQDTPLMRRLREVKRIKEAAQVLGEKEREALNSFPRPKTPRSPREEADFSEVSLLDLLDALRCLLRERSKEPTVMRMEKVTISVPQRMRTIWDEIRSRERVEFVELLNQGTTRAEIIVTFLALLELARLRRVRMIQERVQHTILIERSPHCPPGEEELVFDEAEILTEQPPVA